MTPSRFGTGRKRMHLAILFAVSLVLAACDSGSDSPTDAQMDAVAADQQVNDNYPCTKEVTAVLTFWDTVCWGGTIKCDGQAVQTTVDGEEGNIGICDPDITCEAPAVETFVYSFEFTGGACEFCSSSDDTDICVPLNDQCKTETVEITASGSEEDGPHPMVCCPDDPDCV